ncbi:MAG TPA: hypothetical protein VMZ27_14240, partial [Candidatus Saccharimonadales bacterium]|nr:hypothetical protein [Candidatus Saccharimonadales bacterium]
MKTISPSRQLSLLKPSKAFLRSHQLRLSIKPSEVSPFPSVKIFWFVSGLDVKAPLGAFRKISTCAGRWRSTTVKVCKAWTSLSKN